MRCLGALERATTSLFLRSATRRASARMRDAARTLFSEREDLSSDVLVRSGPEHRSARGARAKLNGSAPRKARSKPLAFVKGRHKPFRWNRTFPMVPAFDLVRICLKIAP